MNLHLYIDGNRCKDNFFFFFFFLRMGLNFIEIDSSNWLNLAEQHIVNDWGLLSSKLHS